MNPVSQFFRQHWRRCTLEAALVAAWVAALAGVLFAFGSGGQGDAAQFFGASDNVRFMAVQALGVALGALGMALVLLVGGIDLSAGACAVLAGVVAAALLRHGTPVMPSLAVALAVGGALGALNGVLTGFARQSIAPWAITLGTFGIARGAAWWVAGDDSLAIPLTGGALRGLNLAPAIVLVVVLAAGLAVLLRMTIFGRHLRAIGSNEEAARLCGVRVRLTKGFVYTVAGLLFALAGLASMAVASQGSVRAALGLEITFVAAAMLGGVKLGGGAGGVLGALAGALGLTVLLNGVQQAGWPVPLQEIAMGGLLVAAVGINRLRHGGC